MFAHVLLGVLIGNQLNQARIDSIYWPFMFGPVNVIKSKLTLNQRQEGLLFYNAVGNPNLDYALLVCVALVLIGFIARFLETKKIKLLFSFLATVGAVVVEIVFSRPVLKLIRKVGSKVTNKATGYLVQMSMFHAASLALLLVAASFIEEKPEDDEAEDEEEEEETKKTQ
jgi:hypothetical protein